MLGRARKSRSIRTTKRNLLPTESSDRLQGSEAPMGAAEMAKAI